MTETTTSPGLEALAAEAERVASEAAALDPAGQPLEAPPTGPDNAQIIAGAIAAGRDAFSAFTRMKSLKIVLTDEKVQALAAVWSPVCDKYGIDLSKYLGDYGPEIAAVVMTLTIGYEIRGSLRAEIAYIDSKKAEAVAAPTTEPQADAVPFA